MKIAYVCYWDMQRQDGVTGKIRSQLSLWRQAGHEAELFYLTAREASEDSAEGRAFVFSSARSRLTSTSRLTSAVREHRPDVVYIRYDLFAPTVVSALTASTAVTEINSNVQAELRQRSSVAALYERVQRR